jgi:hypothetical protein
MNTKHALQIALRCLILLALTAGAAACGAAPEGQNTVDEKSLTSPSGSEPATEATDPDAAAAPSGPTTDPTAMPIFGPVAPVENVAGPGARPGGVIPPRGANMPHAQ